MSPFEEKVVSNDVAEVTGWNTRVTGVSVSEFLGVGGLHQLGIYSKDIPWGEIPSHMR